MDKCECWKEVKYPVYGYNAICLGTKEKEYCSCNGDVSKCSFIQKKERKIILC